MPDAADSLGVPDANGYIVRRMTRADLDTAFGFCIEEDWNPGRHDMDSFFATDPNGFFLGELNGEPVGSISGVRYDETFGFIGIYIVRPPFRGQGYGLRLWNAAIDYLSARNIGLDGVIAQQENYRRAGFHFAYRNVRYAGVGGGAVPKECALLASVPFETLAAYDALHFPAARPQFLREWIRQPEATALGVVEAGALVGYGVIRARQEGFHIGPLFADTPEVADALFRGLGAQRPGATIFIDVPEINPTSLRLVARYGLKPVFETARMYTGAPPPLPYAQIYGVTTFELG